MKIKFLLLFLATLLPLSAFKLNADENKHKQEIPLNPTINGNQEKDNRIFYLLPIECHYYGMMNAVVTTVFSDLGDVLLTVTNCSTGNVWYDSFDTGMQPQTMLSVSGEPGLYEIVYITETGDVYEGYFEIH